MLDWLAKTIFCTMQPTSSGRMYYKVTVDPESAVQQFQIYTSYVIVAGHLTTSTYPAVYAPYVTDAQSAALTDTTDTGQPGLDAPRLEFWFRFLNGMSFAFSLLTITGSLSLMIITLVLPYSRPRPDSSYWLRAGPARFFFVLHYSILISLLLTILLALVHPRGAYTGGCKI